MTENAPENENEREWNAADGAHVDPAPDDAAAPAPDVAQTDDDAGPDTHDDDANPLPDTPGQRGDESASPTDERTEDDR